MGTDGDRKFLLNVDWDKGERAWKLWVTPQVGENKARYVFKVLTKLEARKDSRKPTLSIVHAFERMDGTGGILFEGDGASEDEIEGFVRGAQSMLYMLFGKEAEFEVQDYRDCDSYEKFARKVMEETGNEVTDDHGL